jgi:hypothetical protein
MDIVRFHADAGRTEEPLIASHWVYSNLFSPATIAWLTR